jgi:hypothetical protein
MAVEFEYDKHVDPLWPLLKPFAAAIAARWYEGPEGRQAIEREVAMLVETFIEQSVRAFERAGVDLRGALQSEPWPGLIESRNASRPPRSIDPTDKAPDGDAADDEEVKE